MSTPTKTMRIRFSREWLALFERAYGQRNQMGVRPAVALATFEFRRRRRAARKPVGVDEIPTIHQVRYYLKKKQEAAR